VLHEMWIAPLIALTLAQIAVIATSVYLHRGLAHRALQLHPVTEGAVGRCSGSRRARAVGSGRGEGCKAAASARQSSWPAPP
jgi:hypothetical protein